MKIKLLKSVLSTLIIISLIFTMAASAAANEVFSHSISLADNLEFVNRISRGPAGRLESFELRMTGQGDARPVVMSSGTVFGGFTISRMVQYAEELGKNVLAAVNTDFFSMRTGVPMGLLVSDSVLKSGSYTANANAVGFGYDGSVHFSFLSTIEMTFRNEGGGEGNNEGEVVRAHHFNKYRTDTGGLTIFTEHFSTVSTRTDSPGWFVRFRILEGTPSIAGTMRLQVTETFEYDGAVPIGQGYMILTSADHGGWGGQFVRFSVGDYVTFTTNPSDPALANARHATGGGDVIVAGGQRNPNMDWSRPFAANRHPRTAFGVRADGTIISYVIDGRINDHSVGKTLGELADELIRLGAVQAINFDGGGSSALSVRLPGDRNNTVVSRPSEGAQRACSTYLLFVTDLVPDSVPRHLSIARDGAILLPRSSVDLSFVARDRGYMPVAVPGDIRAVTTAPGASITGARYTAGYNPGREIISLHSDSTGASGTGAVVVISSPTVINASRRGSAQRLYSVSMQPGEVLELDVTSSFHGRPVIAQLHSYDFSVSGDIGEFTAPGVFRASSEMVQSGTISVSAGTTRHEIRVEIGGFGDMQNHWARSYAEALFGREITTGITPYQFGPELTMIRADFILMLHRAVGAPNVVIGSNFVDVMQADYFAAALAWARYEGIVDIPPGNLFNPRAPLTREQAFIFTYRALNALGVNYTPGTAADIARFPDSARVPQNAVVPTATLINLGIVEGSDGFLLPNDTMTRAQMAKVLVVTLALAD